MAAKKKKKAPTEPNEPGPLIREASLLIERAVAMEGDVLELSRQEAKVINEALRVARLIDAGQPLEAFPGEGGESCCDQCGMVQTHRIIDWHPSLASPGSLLNIHHASAIYYACNECGAVLAVWTNRTHYESLSREED